MSNSGNCREIPNRLLKVQRFGIRVLATIGYFSICGTIGASIHWYKHRPAEGLQIRYNMPMVQTEEEDIRLLIDSGEESEPTKPETEIHI